MNTEISNIPSFYSGNCHILHVNSDSCDILEEIKSENCIMSTLSTNLAAELKPRGLALKFTAQGLETYHIQNRQYRISSGKYLLVNESVPAMEVVIKDAATWGMCVDLDPCLVDEVLYQMLYPDDLEGYRQLNSYLLSPEIFVREAMASDSMKALLNEYISISISATIDKPALELIFDLISLLVQENTSTIRSYYRLKLSKLSTRKELFYRLLKGKEVLEDSVLYPTSIKEVANESCLSEFRFYKLFKECFGISPYQYLVNKRIACSLQLRRSGLNWSEIARMLNFSDLAAFSNAFKKVTGVAPTKYK
ncbi:helix-turn-helix domain-containing protein [Pontibacter sp. MBLB2868]|uniref:helix-turn-helix domain-containing protein n=1 Tax=Pontibacter sp. MBLB2868 TaxID=3451555 RepID=UPI003F75252F